jgi:hypothetical protein
MLPIYVSKNLIAASSTGVAAVSSGGVVTLNTSSLGTGRRLIVWGSTSVAGTWTITGLSETGTTISETVSGSTTGAAVATTQDFISVTSIVSPTFTSTQGYVGTNTQGGTPWKGLDTNRNPINVGFLLGLTSTANSMGLSFEYTMDAPIYNVQAAHWDNPNTTVGPQATISSLGSTVASNTLGSITTPITAWRETLTSTSSGAGSGYATVLQSG